MTTLASEITSLTVVYSIVYSGVNQRKHQSSASLAFVREIHQGPVNFPHKWPVTRKMFPFDDVIMGNRVSHVPVKQHKPTCKKSVVTKPQPTITNPAGTHLFRKRHQDNVVKKSKALTKKKPITPKIRRLGD